jgi:hypothetical protein
VDGTDTQARMTQVSTLNTSNLSIL